VGIASKLAPGSFMPPLCGLDWFIVIFYKHFAPLALRIVAASAKT
jgi:hypothetical protein